MNLNEVIWQVLRSGFPLLILVLYGMLSYSVWKNQTFSSRTKWKWISIIALPGLLALGAFLWVISLDSDNQLFLNIMAIVVLFLPFTGVLAWLIGTR
jgi:hypothetical protein